MSLVILGITVKRDSVRGISRKWPKILRNALLKTVQFWHEKIMPRHFAPGNKHRYKYASRRNFYLHYIKKQEGVGEGKTVLLILKGRSPRDAKYGASFTATQHIAKCSMKMPAYFTHPYIGAVVDPRTGRLRHIRQQPDKPAELKATTLDERDRLGRVYKQHIVSGANAALKGQGVT